VGGGIAGDRLDCRVIDCRVYSHNTRETVKAKDMDGMLTCNMTQHLSHATCISYILLVRITKVCMWGRGNTTWGGGKQQRYQNSD